MPGPSPTGTPVDQLLRLPAEQVTQQCLQPQCRPPLGPMRVVPDGAVHLKAPRATAFLHVHTGGTSTASVLLCRGQASQLLPGHPDKLRLPQLRFGMGPA